jgi:ABC-type Fe3+ transport system permease subunit
MQRAARSSHTALLLVIAALLAIASWLTADSIERQLLRNSLVLVGLVTVVALPPTLLLGFLLARTNLRWRTFAVACLAALILLPLYLHLCGWEAAFGRQGWHTFGMGSLAAPVLSSWRGAVIVHALYALPWATALMAAAFSAGDESHEELALLDGDSWQVIRLVTLPQLYGGIVAAALWIVVTTSGEMTVTNIYLVPTYAEDVYNAFAGNADVQAITVHALPLAAFAAALAALGSVLIRQLVAQPLGSAAFRWPLGRVRAIVSLLACFVLVVLLAVPAGNLIERLGSAVQATESGVARSWSAAKAFGLLSHAPGRYSQEIVNSLLLASLVAGAVVPGSLWAAWRVLPSPALTRMSWLIAGILLALPGPLIGIAVIAMMNHDLRGLTFLYDRTLAPPIVAVSLRIVPLVFLIAWLMLANIARQPLEAAELDGASLWQRLVKIALPQRRLATLALLLATFSLAAGDVSAGLLVLPPGPLETVPRRMFGMVHVGADDQVAALGLLAWLVHLALAAVIFALGFRSFSCRTVVRPELYSR